MCILPTIIITKRRETQSFEWLSFPLIHPLYVAATNTMYHEYQFSNQICIYEFKRKPTGTAHHTVDLEEKPLLFEYYANTLNPIIDRRNFDDIDNHLGKRSIDTEPDRYPPKRFFLERPRALPIASDQQQKQVRSCLIHYANHH